MKVTYTGIKQDLSVKLQGKLDAKFGKLSRLLEKRGEKEAHVVVTSVRHLHKVEITIPFYEHQLVGLASDADLFTALYEALEKLEVQAVKNRGKWREKHRRTETRPAAEESAPLPGPGRAAAKKNGKSAAPSASQEAVPVNVFRVNHHDRRKPMTLEEAMLEMEQDRDYVVYRDAEKESISMLVRRRDGHFDLIEV
jgi:putative sigma-54 modulation protein